MLLGGINVDGDVEGAVRTGEVVHQVGALYDHLVVLDRQLLPVLHVVRLERKMSTVLTHSFVRWSGKSDEKTQNSVIKTMTSKVNCHLNVKKFPKT